MAYLGSFALVKSKQKPPRRPLYRYTLSLRLECTVVAAL